MLRNELFLVIGGSGGIGRALCEGLAVQGFTSLVGFRKNAEGAQKIADATGGIAINIDLMSAESIQALPATIERTGKRLAGIIFSSSPPPDLVPFGKIEQDVLQRHLQVNVIGPQLLLATLVRHFFRKQKSGIVGGILTQAMGESVGTAMAGMGAYIIGKYGFLGVLATLAADYPWLKVHTLSPGYTTTPMLESFDERFLDMQRARGAFSDPADVAKNLLDMLLHNEL